MMKAWYETHFQEEYLTIYKQRDEQVEQELETLLPYLPDLRGKKVLDLCCGYGRHSRYLAGLGARVTGVDLSAPLLKEAISQSVNEPIQYMRCDMREIPIQNEMDLVLNLFTSFGYFDSNKENEAVLKKVYQALKPGGIFLFDYLNPSFVKQHLVPFSRETVGGKEITQYRTIEKGKVNKTIFVTDLESATKKQFEEKVKLYSMQHLKKMMERNGLDIVHTFGDYNASPFHNRDAPRTIFICRKGECQE
jgi:SAM-dependent methyltransferase